MKKNTKDLIWFVCIGCFVAFCFCLFGWTVGKSYDPTTTYEAPAIVTEIDDVTGWVTLTDWAGEAWCIRGENYEIGQLVVAKFNDNNSPDYIYDDMIVNVECAPIE